jgi:DNA-binding NtrC family response regulator
MALQDALEAQGFLVDEAEEAAQALEILEGAQNVEILVTDVKMPGMDGLTLANRAVAICPNLKIVIMSGHADAHDASIPVNAVFIRKPFPLSAFAEWLWAGSCGKGWA